VKKSELYGLVGTVIAGILVVLLLWLIVLPGLKAPEEEGIMVSFGETVDGGGNSPVAQPVSKPEPAAATPTQKVTAPTKEDVITQNDNSAVIAEQKRKQQEAALKRAQEEQEKKQAEQKKKEQTAINNANNTMSRLFGNSNSTGTGNTSGNTQQGNPLGSGTSGGNSANVVGRKAIGEIVEPDSFNQEGKAVVSIVVNSDGVVIFAKVTGGNISDSETKKLIENAAKRTRFTTGSGEAKGTITYNLRFS